MELVFKLLELNRLWLLEQISSFYHKWENLPLKVTFFLISLQFIHLFWLSHWIIFHHTIDNIPDILFVSIDYLEIPALLAGMVFYSSQLRNSKMNVLYFSLLAVQILHITWISDEFVLNSILFNNAVILTWVAVGIDYLELIVIYDLYKRIRKQ